MITLNIKYGHSFELCGKPVGARLHLELFSCQITSGGISSVTKITSLLALVVLYASSGAAPLLAQECALEDNGTLAMSTQAPVSAPAALPSVQPGYARTSSAPSANSTSVAPEPSNYMKNWPSYSHMALNKQGAINRSGAAAGRQTSAGSKRHYVMPVHLLPGQTSVNPYNSARTGMQGRTKTKSVQIADSHSPCQKADRAAHRAKSTHVMSYTSTPGVIAYNTRVTPYVTAPLRSYKELGR